MEETKKVEYGQLSTPVKLLLVYTAIRFVVDAVLFILGFAAGLSG
jgi:hypothetical protein